MWYRAERESTCFQNKRYLPNPRASKVVGQAQRTGRAKKARRASWVAVARDRLGLPCRPASSALWPRWSAAAGQCAASGPRSATAARRCCAAFGWILAKLRLFLSRPDGEWVTAISECGGTHCIRRPACLISVLLQAIFCTVSWKAFLRRSMDWARYASESHLSNMPPSTTRSIPVM